MLELFRNDSLLLNFNQAGTAGTQYYVMIYVNFEFAFSWFQPGGGLARPWRLFCTTRLHCWGQREGRAEGSLPFESVWQRPVLSILHVNHSLLSCIPFLLILLLLLIFFFFNCCFQWIVLFSALDLYLLCLQLSFPACYRGKAEGEKASGSMAWSVSVGALKWGVPFLNHDMLLEQLVERTAEDIKNFFQPGNF